MSRATRGVVAAVLGASIAAFASTPASAAIIKPSAAHSITVGLNAKGDPIPFTLEASGYQPGEPVYIEVCDGEQEGMGTWSPTTDCDETTSGAAVQAGSNGDVIFPVGGQSEVQLFRGSSPDSIFNCLAPADIKKGATPAAGMGNVVPLAQAVYPAAGTSAYDANQPPPHAADPSIPSWSDCQLRISSTDETATTDQQFVTLHLGGAVLVSKTGASSGSSKSSAAFTIAGAAVLIVAGGLLYLRRRRNARLSV